MKILLREYGSEKYVWCTAKYNHGSFYVDGEKECETNIVSIINDNRKKYIQCSSCGKVFRRGDPRFQIHKENAIKPETCFDCPGLCTDNARTMEKRYARNSDGTYIEKIERSVRLQCSRSGLWTYYDIDSERAIEGCNKRLCAKAKELEISDFFTLYPGVFDDIITIDRLLDEGYDVRACSRGETSYEFEAGDEYTIGATINYLGIVDRFFVWYDGDKYIVYYSKKYNELFTDIGKYIVWDEPYMEFKVREEIKAKIAKLYR